jgi:hypothetical protein
VNPSIDAHGIGAEEMDELGDDFREDYLSGVYDVRCAECGGERVVPACRECDEPAIAKERGTGDRRERVSTEHYETCFEHLSAEERQDLNDLAAMFAEQAAERRMGA